MERTATDRLKGRLKGAGGCMMPNQVPAMACRRVMKNSGALISSAQLVERPLPQYNRTSHNACQFPAKIRDAQGVCRDFFKRLLLKAL